MEATDDEFQNWLCCLTIIHQVEYHFTFNMKNSMKLLSDFSISVINSKHKKPIGPYDTK